MLIDSNFEPIDEHLTVSLKLKQTGIKTLREKLLLLQFRHCSFVQFALQTEVRVRVKVRQKWYFTGDSTDASASASKSPTYATWDVPRLNVKL